MAGAMTYVFNTLSKQSSDALDPQNGTGSENIA